MIGLPIFLGLSAAWCLTMAIIDTRMIRKAPTPALAVMWFVLAIASAACGGVCLGVMLWTLRLAGWNV